MFKIYLIAFWNSSAYPMLKSYTGSIEQQKFVFICIFCMYYSFAHFWLSIYVLNALIGIFFRTWEIIIHKNFSIIELNWNWNERLKLIRLFRIMLFEKQLHFINFRKDMIDIWIINWNQTRKLMRFFNVYSATNQFTESRQREKQMIVLTRLMGGH